MKIEIKPDSPQMAGSGDRLSLWIFKNDKTFICSVTVEERKDAILLTIVPNDTTVKTHVLEPDRTAQDYGYMMIESPMRQK